MSWPRDDAGLLNFASVPQCRPPYPITPTHLPRPPVASYSLIVLNCRAQCHSLIRSNCCDSRGEALAAAEGSSTREVHVEDAGWRGVLDPSSSSSSSRSKSAHSIALCSVWEHTEPLSAMSSLQQVGARSSHEDVEQSQEASELGPPRRLEYRGLCRALRWQHLRYASTPRVASSATPKKACAACGSGAPPVPRSPSPSTPTSTVPMPT
mmetsp:Transcript_35856/g.83721  ORF Transcript_35856/g.83721 Transcript_35856/m.83721 type:complete len:209 (+) Transcript_35856:148-774(+)